MRLYGIKIHDRLTPEDPDLATVMYSPFGNPEGPWSDIATCDRDWAWEILNALQDLTEAEEIKNETKRFENLLHRTYRLAVGHGPNFSVFETWEEAIEAYEQRQGDTDFCATSTHEEIEYLKKTVKELVPYMVQDVYNGLWLNQVELDEECCEDCEWFKKSRLWETRIRSGEFGSEAVELLDRNLRSDA